MYQIDHKINSFVKVKGKKICFGLLIPFLLSGIKPSEDKKIEVEPRVLILDIKNYTKTIIFRIFGRTCNVFFKFYLLILI